MPLPVISPVVSLRFCKPPSSLRVQWVIFAVPVQPLCERMRCRPPTSVQGFSAVPLISSVSAPVRTRSSVKVNVCPASTTTGAAGATDRGIISRQQAKTTRKKVMDDPLAKGR